MIKLVAFLGNFGREYEGTRHNVGWTFAESLPFYNKLSWAEKFKGEFCAVDFQTVLTWLFESGLAVKKDGSMMESPKNAPEKIYFLKPLTYMNLSGESIGEVARFYKINPDEVLAVHDELELPIGTFSLKFGGGLGGHNGLRSTKAALGTADFWRLRFGLTKPATKDIAGYVLSKFTADENIILAKVFDEAKVVFSKLILASEPARLLQNYSKVKVEI